MCKIKNEDDKYYPQIYFDECAYKEKKSKEKRRHIKEKIVIPKSDESEDESIE